MTTHFVRPSTLARRLFVGILSLATLIAVAAASGAPKSPQEHPDRPPWAQKPKSPQAAPVANPLPADDAQDRSKIKVNVNLVNVLVSVLDEHNRPAPDLPCEAFQVLDEDNPQTIAVFEKETQQPLDLALMIDASLSAQLTMPAQREAAVHFIQQVLRKGDRLAIYSVDENVTQLAAFTDNVGHLQEVVRHVPAGAGTSIYDAVYLGSKTLARQGTDRRRVIILITDGGETTSHADFDSARREAVRSNSLLYTVVIRSVKNESGRNTAGEHALETITDSTGGAVFYPDSSAELDSIFDRINRELRTQYRLGYYPNPRGPADTYRRIEVKITLPGDRKPSTQAGETQNASAPALTPAEPANAPAPAYSVRHRKSYYTGLP